MSRINGRYKYETSPVANKEAMVKGEKYRFTVLTSRLIRLEYNERGQFEDRATQCVLNRCFDVPEFSVKMKDDVLTLTTKDICVVYNTKKPFAYDSLSISYAGENTGIGAVEWQKEWHFGEEIKHNLFGTARTLDAVNGECELENGIMTQGEVAVYDDSNSLIIAEDGWVEPRVEGGIDQYVFCYGCEGEIYDYLGCLKDFYTLTGSVPLIPRYALGNWWSRYHGYSQDEYTELMKRFKKENIPFSVAVIDMDWHLVDIDKKYGSGWTGYTWNEELFPDHKAFIGFLHDENMKVSLNLHPHQGIAGHEKQYKKMAEAMGVDAENEETVEFDIANPKFVEKYFEIMHHPLEEEGVDFWWIDWQQGNTSKMAGLDPLWMLNHYHYIDNGKNGKRPLLFSRYAGVGSHRYPIGFSGDTHISWESLKFQPYFTANASNIGYGWWSHDIGGHIYGYRSDELTARWVQFGVFSPINRLHSAKSPFMGKEPWNYGMVCEESMKKFLKLRHKLIPYLYSMNYRAANYGEPLLMPLYYKWHTAESYKHRTEYSFGTEMIVSPIVDPGDKATMCGSAEVYFPEGKWYDFFTNYAYKGGRTLTVYRDLLEMPVFVKAGGIVPMSEPSQINDIQNPRNMRIKVFMGASNTFELYEDDGKTNEYLNNVYAITKMSLNYGEKTEFVIARPKGDLSVIPNMRSFVIEFIGTNPTDDITVLHGGKETDADICTENGCITVKVCNAEDEVKVIFNKPCGTLKNPVSERALKFLLRCEIEFELKSQIYDIVTTDEPVHEKMIQILNLKNADENVKNAVIEIITADV